ncbi:YqzH family protein [Fictibacillus sp. WQ 8-8]|uniref:YqzH family protein n=1 Tax=unclassified Fictibacillus TaxID=2644029 RepID=UPI000781A63B|nr:MULTISPECIES: YqzH family protein [unclassified Fictibacillus]MCQ6266124.1 YqzH family protein [Fictibacillus sp. WQ 8-8]MED2972656.1 YqzH family protein [Fictibacillus sp. B-59209]UZJ80738.1 YqzH family protein [Fictibacillus sp. KU28468]
MENQLLRKWLEKALLDYFYEKEAIPYTEKDYALLQERIKKELQTEEAEDPYLTVQDVVYSFITKE